MDRIIRKKTWTPKRLLLTGGAAILLVLAVYQFLFADKRSSLRIEREKVTIASVSKGAFQEFIPQTGTVQPKVSFFLDAVEGGIIGEIYRESGSMVEKGDKILSMANSNLQLEVASQETQLFEQLNNLRTTRLALEQNSLTLKAQLAEIDYNIQRLQPKMRRNEALLKDKLISQEAYDDIKEELDWNLKRRRLTYAAFRQDSLLRVAQLNQLNASEERLNKNLEMVGNILKNLEVEAPVSGQLSLGDLEIGQSIQMGQRLGQIDGLDSFKIQVSIDELYLPRVGVGQEASFELNGHQQRAIISKVYPNVTNGMFEVDMDFKGNAPKGIRRGQSIRLRLELGQSEEAVLLPTGGFYKDTGGNWVYVLSADGSRAVRRSIQLGRKNSHYYEVLEGLEAGEQVITSGYEYFGNIEVLVF
ncbi:efflux RND transporter periplasmic adaptor subunit [Nafulsella turpanensis]|uniref:efflux RND transporter periplasmic adaptor subunit n=1 Tax=Nafulsella turpanensis TaxID=1265690 RepID=UPI00034AF17E|nr:efflux RND transporter periplasmic adaptor subunit [Nafulsella turpanensis]